jgi:hypothetical protein
MALRACGGAGEAGGSAALNFAKFCRRLPPLSLCTPQQAVSPRLNTIVVRLVAANGRHRPPLNLSCVAAVWAYGRKEWAGRKPVSLGFPVSGSTRWRLDVLTGRGLVAQPVAVELLNRFHLVALAAQGVL